MPDLQNFRAYRCLDGKENEVKDYFGRETFADTIYSLIVGGKLGKSYVLGVSGGWGTGKTWVLETLFKRLEQDGHHLCVWFNAWQYENRDAVFYPVVQLISEKGKEVVPQEERQLFLENVNQLKSMIVGSSQWVPILAGILNPAGGVIIGALYRLLRLCGVKYEMDSWVSNIEKISEEFSKLIGRVNRHDRTVVVFVDDMDRCSPESVIKLLEQLKQLARYKSESKVVFIIGIDDRAVRSAIKARYGEMFTNAEADSYLEKIVTFRLDIPEVSQKQFEVLLGEQFQELGVTGLPIPLLASALVSGRMHNIRKLYLAIKSFHVIQTAYVSNQSFRQVQAKIFMFCLIKEFWPNVYHDILTLSNHVFLELLTLSPHSVGERRSILHSNSATWHDAIESYITDNSLFYFLAVVQGYFPMPYPEPQVKKMLRFCQLMESVAEEGQR